MRQIGGAARLAPAPRERHHFADGLLGQGRPNVGDWGSFAFSAGTTSGSQKSSVARTSVEVEAPAFTVGRKWQINLGSTSVVVDLNTPPFSNASKTAKKVSPTATSWTSTRTSRTSTTAA
ncbi:hypothetical protein [Sutterella wadsworthensis]|uniref:hypothetical protein n=1 Tax=Sutterella wadsworthensis TaxID=40545 RepID=UPI001D09957C|nr:hypothetical protein [Sutterella wadsworthensis]MCB7457230.1 hypothetical protein [Sutterella wadsworthensis]